MKHPSSRLLVLALFAAFAISSCNKIPINPPIPIQSLEEFPFKSYLDSLNGASVDITYGAGVPIDPLVLHGEVNGQAEYAYAFRTSVPGLVTSLAVLEPVAGYSHAVTLWDSATGAVLAEANVPSLNAGHWTSVSLALQGNAVPILANHGYIVGFNTLAIGDAIGAGTPGDQTYFIFGIYYNSPTGIQLTNIDPFVSKTFTFEGEYATYYNSILAVLGPPFPGGLNNPNGDPGNNLFGACDIGFIPAP